MIDGRLITLAFTPHCTTVSMILTHFSWSGTSGEIPPPSSYCFALEAKLLRLNVYPSTNLLLSHDVACGKELVPFRLRS